MLVELGNLTTELLVISGIVKVIVDLLKLQIPIVNENSNVKYITATVLSVLITVLTGVGFFDPSNQVLYYVGLVGAGLVVSLGSNMIHEVVKILQMLKDLKK